MQILVSGVAGFIGSFLAEALLLQGHQVYGIDSVNDYYDTSIKYDRLKKCGITPGTYGQIVSSDIYPSYQFQQLDLCDKENLNAVFQNNKFDCVINLAAQAGVRYSLKNPHAYLESNIIGFLNILEACRYYSCARLIYASSSSVYGNDTDIPFKETARVDHPVSMYAATKKSNELMAYTYSYLYQIHTIGLRFFTVYGPYGRPDMAPMLFAKAIDRNEPIHIFNNGNLSRDFTYIDDIVKGITTIVAQPEKARKEVAEIPAVIYNIGHGSPIKLLDFIHLLEKHLGKEAQKEYVGMQPGDVYQTWADTTRLKEDYHYIPATSLEEGIKKFADWYKTYYK